MLLLLVLAPADVSPGGQARTTDSRGRADRQLDLLRSRYVKERDSFVRQLDELSGWSAQRQLDDVVSRISALRTPVASDRVVSVELPRYVRPPIDVSPDSDQGEAEQRLRRVQTSFAVEVYRIARNALRQGFPSHAMQLVREVARHDPDHRFARALLGYVRYADPARADQAGYQGEWVTPYASRMLRRRHVWHDKYGWILSTHVRKYNDGLRPFRGKWITAQRDAVLRRDFQNAWVVRTDHFEVRTNHSLERGVAVARSLERYHTFFFQTFAAFFETPDELRKRFQNSTVRGMRNAANAPPYKVHYYAAKQEFVDRLIERIPRIAMTNGLYYQTDQTSYFFHDVGDESDSTLFHEATHQFFDVSSTNARRQAALKRAGKVRQRAVQPWVVAEKDDFWVIEGIACYMESFRHDKERSLLGDPNYVRFQAARFRLMNSDFYVPLQDFAELGMQQFQMSSEIRQYYTQAAGLVHFFMHFDDGRYREHLIAHLTALYRPNLRRPGHVPSLAELTGCDFSELDRQYRQYMKEFPVAGNDPDGASTAAVEIDD